MCSVDYSLSSLMLPEGSDCKVRAVLNMNKHDNGHREFILKEMEDYADTVTVFMNWNQLAVTWDKVSSDRSTPEYSQRLSHDNGPI